MHIAIIGATGAVGKEAISLLERGKLHFDKLSLFASSKSFGKKISFLNKEIVVQKFKKGCLKDVDIALFSCGSSISKEYEEDALSSNTIIVDNSSAFRMRKNVPLVIPEINIGDIQSHQNIIANPNCSTIIMLMAVYPLQRLFPISSITVSTYQAVSGAGFSAIQELSDASASYLRNEEYSPKVFSHPIAFNLFSHDSVVNHQGYNEEEVKMIRETHKILNNNRISINPTCIRVPVFRSHSMSICLEFENEIPQVDKVSSIFAGAPGIKIVDDRTKNYFPMPQDSNGSNYCFIGRIRQSSSLSNYSKPSLLMFVVGDQLLKGAAFNAIQIIYELCGISSQQYDF